MKFVIAPDSFKGSLTAKEVSESIYQGLFKIFPDARFELIPMADGGEGTMQALVDSCHGKIYKKTVKDPLNRETTAQYAILPNSTAVIEMASASGLQYVDQETANPFLTTTYGTGQLINAALKQGAKTIIVGLGGSATNDGGVGAAMALGIKFFNKANQEIAPNNQGLAELTKIDLTSINPALKTAKIILASDVTNPLTGLNGASFVFGHQKGATDQDLPQLDRNLQHFAQLIHQQLNLNFENTPGAGAAGGLGFGLLSFTNAKIQSGIKTVLALSNFNKRVQNADFVFTGEGATDFQTQYGKTPFGVAQAAKMAAPNCQVICLTGNIGAGIEQLYGKDKIDAIFATESGAKPLKQAIKDSKQDLEIISENIGRLIKTIPK